jgi:tRNA A-37 threonylcarbamoyl transferase component Bud32
MKINMKAFTKSYKRKRLKSKIDLMEPTNLGVDFSKNVSIKSGYFRNKKELFPIKNWKLLKQVSRATFYELPNKKVIIVLPELECLNTLGAPTGRDKLGHRRQILLMHELLKKRVNMEIPLGYFKADNKIYYIIYAKKGIPLSERLHTANLEEKTKIAKNLGKELADLHNKGVVHNHPWIKNWVIDGDKPMLVDSKAVIFKDDFPRTTFVTKRTVQWSEMETEDLDKLISEFWYTPTLQKVIKKSYLKNKIN